MVADFQYQQLDTIRLRASKLVYPLQKLVDAPFSLYDDIKENFQLRSTLMSENFILQGNNLLLNAKLQKFAALELENARLRELLNSSADIKEKLFVAKILHIDPEPFTHQVVLDKGEAHGVHLGQPIIDANGIMGVVTSVDALTSKVLLLTDASFAIPVENTRNGVRAIAVGTGSHNWIELQHVPNANDIAVDDLLVTSGFGGRYPFGYPVGVVASVQLDPSQPFATIYVKPKADFERSREILLIHSNDKQGNKK